MASLWPVELIDFDLMVALALAQQTFCLTMLT